MADLTRRDAHFEFGQNWLYYSKSSTPRAMTIRNDVHDWMGGYPYESASTGEVESFVAKLDFQLLKSFPVKVNFAGALGVGCSEFVFRRNGASEAPTHSGAVSSAPSSL